MSEEKITDASINTKHVDAPHADLAKVEKYKSDGIKEGGGEKTHRLLTQLNQVSTYIWLLALVMAAWALFTPTLMLEGIAIILALVSFALGNAAKKNWVLFLADIVLLGAISWIMVPAERLPSAPRRLLPILMLIPGVLYLVHYGAKGISKLLKKERTSRSL